MFLDGVVNQVLKECCFTVHELLREISVSVNQYLIKVLYSGTG